MYEGITYKVIESRLENSPRTVGTHASNIYAKLHVNNRVSAVHEAVHRHLLDHAP